MPLSARFIALFLLLIAEGCNSFTVLPGRTASVIFDGVTAVIEDGEDVLTLSWNPPKNLDNLSTIKYQVFKQETLALSSASLMSGNVFKVTSEENPVAKGALLTEVVGATSIRLAKPIDRKTIVCFQVRIADSRGRQDENQNVICYGDAGGGLRFQGLLPSGVVVAADGKKIVLSWQAAGQISGEVSYLIYNNESFTSAIAEVKTLEYTFIPTKAGQSYTFGVRAKDALGTELNQNLVIVNVPDPSDKTPPEFAGLVSAESISDKKITLRWAPSSSSDLAGYKVFNFQGAEYIGSTGDNFFTVDNLFPNKLYKFIVRAVDSSGNIDTNSIVKEATTLAYSVPDFGGLKSIDRLSGTAGLSQLKLNWDPAVGTVAGYKVYKKPFDFTAPLAVIVGASASSTIIGSLPAASAQSFIVRAYDDSTGTVRSELNTIEQSASTVTLTPPTFAGISMVSSLADSAGLTGLKVDWATPNADGVYDAFVVIFEPGSCSQAFTGGALSLTTGDIRTQLLSGLTPNQIYRVRARALYTPGSLEDNNNVCREGTTSPLPPVFAGISSLTVASGIAGFNSLVASWPGATGSFSQYRIEWATTADFSSVGGTVLITDRTIHTVTLSSLPTNTLIYVRVTTEYTGGSPIVTAGSTVSLSAKTNPIAPNGEGVSAVTVAAHNALSVAWTPPTNTGSVFNGYKLWSACSAQAATDLNGKLSGTADASYPLIQTSATITGLTRDVNCCFQVRAYYSDGTYSLASQSTSPMLCNTPQLIAPTFAGITSITDPISLAGFSQLNVTWPAVSASDNGLFSAYQIAWATSLGAIDWSTALSITDRAQTSTSITGLTANTAYFVSVRAVNSNGTPVASSGGTAVLSATTTPKIPTGDIFSALAAVSSTKVQVSYTPPSSTLSTGGLFNNVFLFISASPSSNVDSFQTSTESGGITTSEIQTITSGQLATITSLPALIRVPVSDLTADTLNNLVIDGFTPNTSVCIKAFAVNWDSGQPAQFLKSNTAARCVTPTAGAPTFAGVSSLIGFGDQQDFTKMVVNWTPPTGECTIIEISATLTPGTANFASPFASAPCTASSAVLAGLLPYSNYAVQARAVHIVGGTSYASGQGIEITRTTQPPVPGGDSFTNATATAVVKNYDRIDFSYTKATAGFYNKIYVWKASNVSASTASTTVLAQAALKGDKSGPTAIPGLIFNASDTVFLDASVTAGISSCYIIQSVYDNGSYYSASGLNTVHCASPPYTPPTFTGVASGSVVGTWPDGTAKIELTLNSVPNGTIDEYWIYYSRNNTLSSFGDLTQEPWQKVDFGDATYDANAADNKILIGGKDHTISGTGYYLVRYKTYQAPDVDTNTAISSSVTVPSTQANLAFVPPSISGLSYGYYIMQYQASTDSGSASSSDNITSIESDIQTCSYQFHVNKNSFHTSCGTQGGNLKVRSRFNTAPITSLSWSSAFTSCRNSSGNGMMMRMPTEEERDRSSRSIGSNYQAMYDSYSLGTGSNCNSNSGTIANTGTRSACVSNLDVYDLAGNLREWVDRRLVPFDISASGQSRFSYGPVVSRMLMNGIDNRSRRLNQANSGGVTLYLAKGSSYSAATKPYGPEVQSWSAASGATTGMRCVAFLNTRMPMMDALSIPEEPVYSSADLPATVASWKVPENLFVGDTKPETLQITINGNAADAIAEGKVTLTWAPWQKTVCDPTCASSAMGLTYNVYRFREPTRQSLLGSNVGWALTGGSNNPFASDKPFDPLAVDASGVPIYTAATSDGKLIATITNCDTATPANCAFEDSVTAGTGFSTTQLYDYVIVTKDAAGNAITAKTQRYRSPYFTGNTSATSQFASFRLEPRFRRAAVFLVDEAYQQSLARPEIMVHVPMDVSGLDHDFFMQKYEASQYNNTVSNAQPVAAASNWPLQGPPGSWVTNAAVCYNKFLQTGSFDLMGCGDGAQVNATTATVQSKQGTLPLVNIDQGAAWKACKNTAITDSGGASYYLSLSTDAQWNKAADWGDVNQDGTIDQNTFTGSVNIASLEWNGSGGDATTIRCHTDNNPASPFASNNSGSGSTANCRSRYGVADMVGNVWEWTTGQQTSAAGHDNGTDGLWYGVTLPTTGSGAIATLKMDLLRAVPSSLALSTVADNSDYYIYGSSFRGAFRGGSWTGGSADGRWLLIVNNAPSNLSADVGMRCAF
ncbi:MAG: hypothetical protein EOP07_01485 [Proteobacteria bacterium]|nr:MAG: hypothetical protein EOP07_01485 [Pseudomonadota bacterium]